MGPMRNQKQLLPVFFTTIFGVELTIGAAGVVGMSAREILELTALGAGTTGAAVAAGAVALRSLRSRRVGIQVAALALTTVASVALAAYAAARAMFISEHDLGVLSVVLLAAGTVSVASSLVLGARIETASTGLIEHARRIGDDPDQTGPDRMERADRLDTTERLDWVSKNHAAEPVRSRVPQELAGLARELEVLEDRLAESRRREQTLEASRRELVAWVSHDLRTPLAGIRAMVEALEDGVVSDPETIARYHRTLREEADHLSALVNDLFELSRAQAGLQNLHFERVSLGDLVSDALAGSAPVAAAKGVRLEGRIVGPPPEVVASAPEVLRALRNLLENAIRHTPSDGSVVVEAGVSRAELPYGGVGGEDVNGGAGNGGAGNESADHDLSKYVYVSVRDTGGGVADDDLTRLMDVSFRSDRARTPGGGTGLGLAIAKGLIEAHQGELTVRNEGAGALFTLRIPKKPSE